MLHGICENSVIHVVSTCISSLVRQYTRTMNRSSFRMISSDMFTVYGNDRVTKLAVISGHASHAFHADFFPRLAKYYVTSQPMNAWKNNTPAAIWEHSQRQSHGSGCIWNPYQLRMLSRVAPSLVNPGNKQQLAQRYLYQLFLSSPTWCLWHVQASGCQPLRVSMFEVRLYSDHL